jgi:hypothetical protein
MLPLELHDALLSLRWWLHSSSNRSIWTKNEKVIHQWSRKVEMKKIGFYNSKKRIFFIAFFLGCSFGFTFQKWFVELEKVLL